MTMAGMRPAVVLVRLILTLYLSENRLQLFSEGDNVGAATPGSNVILR